MERAIFARTAIGPDGETQWQTLENHLRETAGIAAGFCEGHALAKWAHAAGMWHDLGKYADAFQARLHGSTKPFVHATAGAKAAEIAFESAGSAGLYIGRILGYAIAGHHGGLPDGKSAEDASLSARLTREPPPPAACDPDIMRPPPLTMRDLEDIHTGRNSPGDFSFGIAFFIRMLFSCVVDADRLNSEAFADPAAARLRKDYPSLEELAATLTTGLAELARAARPDAINAHRAAILDECLAAAERDTGLFSLTVPTGGGKTLSSLAFALQHARRNGLKRVIYVIPYTSIIEQNARVFRKYLGGRAVIEHHSNYDPPGDEDEANLHSLAAENWDAPVIVTTNVQFFESLFSHKPSRCRKLHNIMESVIILDEAQMLPPNLLRPCLAALRELAGWYRTSIVLCTATQPALSRDDGLAGGLDGVREIISNRERLYDALRRTEVDFISQQDDERITSSLLSHEQVLCIVNTKKHARQLYDGCRDLDGTYHLSALMCPAHRAQVLKEIRSRLDAEEPCRVISTQLIEAGVDVDFPVVYRELAGVDSIAQAAGRCNREGRLPERGRVHVFEFPDGVPGLFRQQAQATQTVLRRQGDDPLSLGGVREYFRELFWMKGEDSLDSLNVLDHLTKRGDSADFPFREIGEKFRLIDDDTTPVFIPWKTTGTEKTEDTEKTEGEKIGDALRGTNPSRVVFRAAQRYTVSLYSGEFTKLHAAGVVAPVAGTSLWRLTNTDLYDGCVGLMLDDPYYRKPESNIG